MVASYGWLDDEFLRRHYPDQVAKGFISAGPLCRSWQVRYSTPISIYTQLVTWQRYSFFFSTSSCGRKELSLGGDSQGVAMAQVNSDSPLLSICTVISCALIASGRVTKKRSSPVEVADTKGLMAVGNCSL